jgi:hypothetical protein
MLPCPACLRLMCRLLKIRVTSPLDAVRYKLIEEKTETAKKCYASDNLFLAV